MLEVLISVFNKNPFGWTLFLLFYAIVGFLLYKNRKKIQREYILFLYRTKAGIKLIDRLSRSCFWKYWGYTGIGVGFLGMAFISFCLVFLVIRFLLNPLAAESAVKLVLPGPFAADTPLFMFVPIEYFIPVLLIVIVIHEGCHGIVARAHQLKLLSTGLGIFLIFPLAFVEPDEKSLEKQKLSKKLSVFAAGPFANFCGAVIALLIAVLLFNPVIFGASAFFIQSESPVVWSVEEGAPADIAGIQQDDKIFSINNIQIESKEDFNSVLSEISPGDTILIKTSSGAYAVETGENPTNSEVAYVGVFLSQIQMRSFLKNSIGEYFVRYLFVLFQWIIILNIGIGLFNLLPLGPTDGGRMFFAVLKKFLKEKKARKIFKSVSIVTLALLLITIAGPFIQFFIGG